MRVAMFSWESLHSILLGGLGVHVTELAAGLQRRGHELHIITRRGPGQADYEEVLGVHYHRIDHGLCDNFVESMNMMCQSMAHRFHEVTNFAGPFDLVHAHDWLTVNAMQYVQQGYGTPGILTMHSTEFGRDGNVLYDGFASWIRDVEAAGCQNARLVISVSGFLADEIQRIYGVSHDKIHVVPNGVNYHAFDGFLTPSEIKSRYGIASMAPTIGCFGRMTVQKGQDMLAEAIPLILASYPEARFIISGDGPIRDEVVRKVQEAGVGYACVLLNTVSRPEYIDLMRSLDIVVVPSRNEPFGIVILEGWAAGKPVVATSAGGPREFVWHNVNGFLVDPGPAGIAHGVGSLLADHDHCRALGRNGRQAVEEVFNWDRIAEYTEGVYRVVTG